MPFQIFDTAALVARVDELASEAPLSYFRDRFFGGESLFSDDEKIYFDVVDTARRLAPFVSPIVEGKVMEHRGFRTKVFEPPYLKPKSVINPAFHMTSRRPGEPIGGSLSMAERRDRLVDETLQDHERAITLREEVMAMEALRFGRVTVSGEGYPTVVLAFGRDAAQSVTLTPASTTWDVTTMKPLDDIKGWARIAFANSGAKLQDVFLGIDAFDALLARLSDAEKQILFNSLRGSQSEMELGPTLPDYIQFEGRVGQFNLFSVSSQYLDEDGVSQELLAPEDVVMASASGLEGRMTYGAILDPRAGYAPVRAFPKNWVSDDPAKEFLMTQSAPLPVPLRPNASFGAKVLP